MSNRWLRRCACVLSVSLWMLGLSAGRAEVVKARFKQGSLHAYLLVHDENGKLIGTGDAINEPMGKDAWRSKTTFHFRDGSIDDETAIYVQHTTMHLISEHHVQRGPSFPKPLDMMIDTAKKSVTWHDLHDGKDEVKVENMDLPADLSNGMLPWMMQNYPRNATELKVSYVVSTPKPRLVKIAITPNGLDKFYIGGRANGATKYLLHVELGGIVGVIAPIVGKAPPDMHAWVVHDSVPTFLRLQAFLYDGGPVWNIQLAGPSWSGPKTPKE